MTPKCPSCEAPLWFAACKCGWQREPKFSDASAEAQAAYAWQAKLYASQVGRYRPSSNPFEQPTVDAHMHREIGEYYDIRGPE